MYEVNIRLNIWKNLKKKETMHVCECIYGVMMWTTK